MRGTVPGMLSEYGHAPAEDTDEDARRVWIVEERPPVREGKVFVDDGQRAAIADNLETAYTATTEAFRGIWLDRALEYGHVREYWNDGDIAELEHLALQASEAADRAWQALGAVVDAHTAQLDAADDDSAEVDELDRSP